MSVKRVKELSGLPLYWLIPRLPSGRLVQSLLTRSVLAEMVNWKGVKITG
ncbi:MAG: hypothetical protein H0Z34_14530 [Brevibacillus sp.]|nr:hypothetical protein [Brevibacillus sp.]